MATTRKYFIKAVPQISDSGSINFVHNEAVPVSRSQPQTWYLADDEGNPYMFDSNTPHGIQFEQAVAQSWKFVNRKQFRMTDSGIEVRNLALSVTVQVEV